MVTERGSCNSSSNPHLPTPQQQLFPGILARLADAAKVAFEGGRNHLAMEAADVETEDIDPDVENAGDYRASYAQLMFASQREYDAFPAVVDVRGLMVQKLRALAAAAPSVWERVDVGGWNFDLLLPKNHHSWRLRSRLIC